MRADKRIRLCLAAAATVIASAAMASGADWSSFLFDASGTRYNAAETVITPANAGQLQLKWAFVFPGADGIASSQPAVANGVTSARATGCSMRWTRAPGGCAGASTAARWSGLR